MCCEQPKVHPAIGACKNRSIYNASSAIIVKLLNNKNTYTKVNTYIYIGCVMCNYSVYGNVVYLQKFDLFLQGFRKTNTKTSKTRALYTNNNYHHFYIRNEISGEDTYVYALAFNNSFLLCTTNEWKATSIVSVGYVSQLP